MIRSRPLPAALARLAAALICAAALACAAPGARASATGAEPITVFAAASLQDALAEVAEAWDGGNVTLAFGGSAAMARQVALGAPADLVILANSEWMDWLEGQGVMAPGSRTDLLGNRLVVIGPEGAAPLAGPDELPARLGPGGRLALGQTTGVPAGIYARAWLEQAGLWKALSPRLAEVENVRVALALVARGEAPLGVTYATDAAAEPRVAVLFAVPPGSHPPITYPMALVDGGGGAAFADFLRGEVAGEIFARHGFALPGAP